MKKHLVLTQFFPNSNAFRWRLFEQKESNGTNAPVESYAQLQSLDSTAGLTSTLLFLGPLVYSSNIL